MFSIMVVDDEKSVREGVCKFLAKQEGLFDAVYSAVDGLDALEQMEDVFPQIVLTDINMPRMSGLEFIEVLKKRNKDIHIIVLSGYDEFSYAQRAMRNGVENYLLKPIDRKELVHVLTSMKESHLIEKKQKEDSQQERVRIQQQQQLLCNRLIHILLNAPVDRNKWQYELEWMGLWNEHVSYGICIMNNEIVGVEKETRDQEWEKLRIAAQQHGLKTRVMLESAEELVILLEIPEEEKGKILECWDRKREYLEKSKAAICFGKLVDSISKVHVSYNMARRELEKQLLKEQQKHEGQYSKNIRELQWQLELYIKTGKKDRIRQCLLEIADNMKKEEVVLVRMAMKETLLIVCSSLEECMGKNQNNWDMMLQMGPYCSAECLEEWVIQLTFLIEKGMELSEGDTLQQQEDIAAKAIKIIQNRWNDSELTLNEIAGELYVSHNYLRYLIKEKTGMSFVKYLTEIRLERSAIMISDTNMKVQDIAIKVGFEDPGYFTRIFTKKYGVSPSKYRDKIMK